MNTNLLITDCEEPIRSDKLFGICDAKDSLPAYTDTKNKNIWIAKVINEKNIDVSFTAIDNCILIFKEGTKDKESTCDGMLKFENNIYLIELKKERKEWITEAINQLENTIRLIYSNHNLKEFKIKKAFVCNKKHPYFKTMDNEFKKKFFSRTNGFRIDIQANIKIK